MDGGGDAPDPGRRTRVLRYTQAEYEAIRQESHERKLMLDHQLFMVDTLSRECAALQAENCDLRRKLVLQEAAVRGLTSRRSNDYISEEDEEPGPVSGHGDGAPDVVKLQEELSQITVENKYMAEELAAMRDQCCTWEADIKRIQSKNKNLEALLSESYLEIATVREAMRCAKEECASLVDRMAALRADCDHNREVLSETRDALGQALGEQHAARAPAMLERGNSIFSELEDSRTMVLDRYRAFKRRYVALAKHCAAQARDISKLRGEKVSLLRLVEETRAEEEGEVTELVRALEVRVADLERSHKQLTSELQVPVRVVTELDAGALRFLETVTADAREEVWTLRRELDDRSLVLLMNQRQLHARQAELRLYRAENIWLKSELSDVKFRQQQIVSADGDGDVPVTPGPGVADASGRHREHFSGVAKHLTFQEPGPVEPQVEFQAASPQQGSTDTGAQHGHSPNTKPEAKKRYPKLVMHHKD